MDEPITAFCPECGSKVEPRSHFCDSCGNNLMESGEVLSGVPSQSTRSTQPNFAFNTQMFGTPPQGQQGQQRPNPFASGRKPTGLMWIMGINIVFLLLFSNSLTNPIVLALIGLYAIALYGIYQLKKWGFYTSIVVGVLDGLISLASSDILSLLINAYIVFISYQYLKHLN